MYTERIDSIPSFASLDVAFDDQLHAEQVESEKDNLAIYVRSLFDESDDPHDKVFLMEGISGYSPVKLTARYIHLCDEKSRQGLTHTEINELFAQMVETDTLAYAREFLYRRPILQTQYEIKNINGQLSVVSPLYDPTAPLHSHISLKEREGAVYQGVKNLEQAILHAKPHSTIISTSPNGWNGVSPLGLPEDQVHVVTIADNEIIDTILRLSMSLEENTALIQTLSGQQFVHNSDQELIKTLSQTVVLLPLDMTPQHVLGLIQEITGNADAWNRMKFNKETNQYVFDRSFTFSDVERFLNQESFLNMNSEVEALVSVLSRSIKENADLREESLREMVRSLGKTALTISESVGFELGEIKERTIHKGDYSKATSYAAEGAGCDTSSSLSSALRDRYEKDGVEGYCTQCGSHTKVICGWCMKCVEKFNSKKAPSEEKLVNETNSLYGSFLTFIIGGMFKALIRN